MKKNITENRKSVYDSRLSNEFLKFIYTQKKESLEFKTKGNEIDFPHKIIFLYQCLHDAVFTWSKNIQTTKNLKLNITERQCWEFEDIWENWACAKSVLSISPVLSADIVIQDKSSFDGKKSKRRKYEIAAVYLGEDYWDQWENPDSFTLNILTDAFLLKIKLPGYEHSLFPCDIRLTDVEGPIFYK